MWHTAFKPKKKHPILLSFSFTIQPIAKAHQAELFCVLNGIMNAVGGSLGSSLNLSLLGQLVLEKHTLYYLFSYESPQPYIFATNM